MPIRPDFERRDDEPLASEREWWRAQIGLIFRSIGRHRRLFLATFALLITGAVLMLLAMPKTFRVEAKVLARRNPALPVHGDEPGADAPTRAAADTILRRANLVLLVQRADLLAQWEGHRAPAERLRDFLVRATGAERTEEERLDAMVERLQKRLSVWTDDSGGTVSIAVDWPDPVVATRLVDLAQQNFLDARYAQEISALGEHLTILQAHADAALIDVNAAVEAVAKLRPGDHTDPTALVPRPATTGEVRPTTTLAVDPALARLSTAMAAKQRSLDDLLEMRRRRVLELQAKLTELRATYTEQYPGVVEVQQALASLTADSPQIAEMRREIAALKADYDHAGGEVAPGGRVDSAGGAAAEPHGVTPRPLFHFAPPPPPLSGELTRMEVELREDRDPAMVSARGQLRDAMDKYGALRDKVQTGQIDLETARAAFAYRYSVVTPAQLPKHPIKPNLLLVLLAAFVAALVTATLSTILVELRTAAVSSIAEIEQLVGRQVIGIVDVPALPPGRAA